jgi:hypothetical protein
VALSLIGYFYERNGRPAYLFKDGRTIKVPQATAADLGSNGDVDSGLMTSHLPEILALKMAPQVGLEPTTLRLTEVRRAFLSLRY